MARWAGEGCWISVRDIHGGGVRAGKKQGAIILCGPSPSRKINKLSRRAGLVGPCAPEFIEPRTTDHEGRVKLEAVCAHFWHSRKRVTYKQHDICESRGEEGGVREGQKKK